MIVDDSAVVRAILSRILAREADFEIVAAAGDAASAIATLRDTEVDVVLLDVGLPGASGVEALPDIVAAGRGARVLIVSSMAEEGAEPNVRALAQGAADVLPKPGGAAFSGHFAAMLVDRLRHIGRADRLPEWTSQAIADDMPARLRPMPLAPLGCLALGASTGGLPALIGFLSALPARIGVPILITQHLPASFMSYFARQLEAASGRSARVAADGDAILADMIHVAPGDAHLRVVRDGLDVKVRLDRRRAASGCRPSVDPMLMSVAAAYGDGGVAVILSGMGRDGLLGASQLVDAKGGVVVQDRASASVWGMPGAIVRAGLASAILPPAELARQIAKRVPPCR